MIIAIANQKGGVAKTTSTHNIGAALAKAGKRVLLIDLDSQASLTISVGLEPLEMKNNIVSLFEKEGRPAASCIYPLTDNLHIIPSIIDLAQLEMEMQARKSREKILDRALAPIKDNYDIILIDCPPQLSILTLNALSCADGVIVPVKTDYLAYRGIAQLVETIEEVKELINPKLEIRGVIATMYESRIKTDQEILRALSDNYPLIGIVKKLAAAKKGVYDGVSAVDQSPTSDIALEYIKMAQMIAENRYERIKNHE